MTQLLPLVDAIPPIAGKPGAPRRRPDALYADRAYDSHLHRMLLWCRGIEPVIPKRRRPHGSSLGRIRWGFVEATHLVQNYGGHEDWMRNQKVLPVILDFLAGKNVAGRDVDMPKLRFIPVRGKPGGVTHPSVGQ